MKNSIEFTNNQIEICKLQALYWHTVANLSSCDQKKAERALETMRSHIHLMSESNDYLYSLMEKL